MAIEIAIAFIVGLAASLAIRPSSKQLRAAALRGEGESTAGSVQAGVDSLSCGEGLAAEGYMELGVQPIWCGL